MPQKQARLMICNCEKSMQIDAGILGKALGSELPEIANQLCRADIAKFESALSGPDQLCVACTQESPLFTEIAEEAGAQVPHFFNIREMAGWARDGRNASPKIAALAAAALLPAEPVRLKTIQSDGLCLVTGSGQIALETALMLNRTLSVSLLLDQTDGLILPETLEFPIFSGKVTRASGTLGAFEVIVDRYAPMLPSSRGEPQFAMARDGAKSNCSVIFDISGKTSLFARPQSREGYFRADANDPAGLMRAIFEASHYAGEFEKPIYVSYDAEICAHSRSKKTGCTKCLDNCPPGAISSDGDNISVDPEICGGCGNCASHCPTGALYYNYPNRHDLIEKVQLLASVYLEAGGKNPVLLAHDATHGSPIINVMSRLGQGLPANVIPMAFHSISSIGHDFAAAAFGAGFRDIFILADPHRSPDFQSTREEIKLMDAIVSGYGHTAGRLILLETEDPDVVETALYAHKPSPEIAKATFVPVGSKRDVARTALAIIADAGSRQEAPVILPATSPYGAVQVDTDGCTLCLSCVSACPMDALRDNPDKPQLRFVESACVQCGICKATCPESVISLVPRLDLSPAAMQPTTLYEEEPAKCTKCGMPFAARSTIERITELLGGRHSMYMEDHRISLLGMCDSCRLEALAEGGKDPFAIAQRRSQRTTDDYIEAEKKGLSVEDFFDEN